MKLVALPCLCVDVFEEINEVRPGGEAINFAAMAEEAFPDMEITLLGLIGDDSYGESILASVADRRIRTDLIRVVKGHASAHNKTYLTPEGDRYYKEGSWDGSIFENHVLNEAEIAEICSADVVFINFWAECFLQVIELKKNHDFKLAVDFDEYRDFAHMEQFAPYVDFFMISGAEELLPYFEDFSRRYPGLFNMSLAERGSVTYESGKCTRVSAIPVTEVVDTTGCGDSYHAGFVCAYLEHGDIEEAMHLGSRLAAKTLSHVGGF